MEPAQALLEVRQLQKNYHVRQGIFQQRRLLQAVRGVDLDIWPGETLGLVGESGCGKSTLGRTLLRLEEASAGQVLFSGQDVFRLRGRALRQLRRNMQIIFQDPYSSLNPRMTVEQILAEPFIIHGEGGKSQIKERVAKLIDIVGMPVSALTRYPHEFSGGQRQRIGIARAVALNPQLVVADEPVSALDVSIQSQILNLLVDLREEFRLSYLFIAHDLAVVEFISDRVAVMYFGSIVEIAPKKAIFANPAHPYTAALLAAVPQPVVDGKKKKAVVHGDVPSPLKPPTGCAFHPRCPHARDLCRQEAPTLRTIADGQKVACHFAEEWHRAEKK